jgi:hypothetical protein
MLVERSCCHESKGIGVLGCFSRTLRRLYADKVPTPDGKRKSMVGGEVQAHFVFGSLDAGERSCCRRSEVLGVLVLLHYRVLDVVKESYMRLFCNGGVQSRWGTSHP